MAGFLSRLFGGSGARRQSPEEGLPLGDLKTGALYSVYNGDESCNYGVVKILVLEPPIVHICVFNNDFSERPEQIDPDSLVLGVEASIFEKALEEGKLGEVMTSQGFGMAHMPLHLRDFIYGWQPVYLADCPVTEDELQGYNIWKSEGGGVFGGL